MLTTVRRLALLPVAFLVHQAASADVTYVDRCLSGKVDRPACKFMIENFWRYNEHLENAARAKGLDPSLIKAMAAVESRFKANAVSPKGATGLLQIMPATGTQLGVHPSNLAVPGANAMAGAQYVRDMYFRFRDWKLTIAAYNAGPGAVAKYGNQIPPYPETQSYVTQVLTLYARFKHSEQLHSKASVPVALPPAPAGAPLPQLVNTSVHLVKAVTTAPTAAPQMPTAQLSAPHQRAVAPHQTAVKAPGSHPIKVNRFQQSVTHVGRFQYLQ